MPNYDARRAGLRAWLASEGIHALLVTNARNVEYLTGFTGSNGQVFITADDIALLTDPRYLGRATALVTDAAIELYDADLTEVLPTLIRPARAGVKLGLESELVPWGLVARIGDVLPGVEIVPCPTAVESLRRHKEPEELDRIREAVKLADATLQATVPGIRQGRTEREVALELDTTMRELGSDRISFEPIVASGPHSAHIHHVPSGRELRAGDLVLVDFGCRVEGYWSDLSRTFVLGRAGEQHREIYDLVFEAQAAGIAGVRVGISGRDADALARRVIEDAGFGDTFGHGLGHGVGLDIHERPRLHPLSKDLLEGASVFTIEPGIYVGGFGGVRIEDCVQLDVEGPTVLGSFPKRELIEL